MTSRERLLTTLSGHLPDCVPVAPDFSNMIPAKLTGKPFWQLYLYKDPPIWEAYVAAAHRFDIDSLMDGYCPLVFPEERACDPGDARYIVRRDADSLVVRSCSEKGGRRIWAPRCTVYYRGNPPVENVPLAKAGVPEEPERCEPVGPAANDNVGPSEFGRIKALLGDQGLCATWLTSSVVLHNEEELYDYYDDPAKYEALAERRIQDVDERFARIMSLPPEQRPDFLCVGGSGTLIFQTVEIFRKLAFPAVKHAIDLATAAGIPTHVHSCGPEAQLVEIMAEETSLTVIDPLEIPPLGNCVLKDLKRRFGSRIVLKGNLHTTDVMLRGTPDQVRDAAKRAIDDGAEGGRFILSTGDQCGRDTPFANLEALVETARTYGKY